MSNRWRPFKLKFSAILLPTFGPVAFLVTFMCLCPKDTNFFGCFDEVLLFSVEQAIVPFINIVWMDTRVIWNVKKDRKSSLPMECQSCLMVHLIYILCVNLFICAIFLCAWFFFIWCIKVIKLCINLFICVNIFMCVVFFIWLGQPHSLAGIKCQLSGATLIWVRMSLWSLHPFLYKDGAMHPNRS